MDFRILGPLEALDEGRPVPLGGSKQRSLLAVLLLHANETLSTERLIDELWGERPPATAAKTVQVHVSRLRKALGSQASNGSDGLVVTRDYGYELKVDPERLDSHQFERLVAEGRAEMAAGRPKGAASALEAALSLWRGAPLADLAYEPFAQHEIARLDDVRLAALEQLNEARLALGDHAEVVGQLETLVGEHPYRERLRAQLMLALYRCDRQADALQAYHDTRRTLVEELGIEPGERLRDLERAILAQDPKLHLAAAEKPAAAETPRSAFPGRHRDASALVGREQELARIQGFLEHAASGPAALVLEGEPGIGKTTLLREAVATAFDAGANVLVARPAAAETALAFAGLRDLLGDALDQLVSELPPPQANALEVALLHREAGGQPVNPHAVAAGVLSALGALARQSSVVVAVDDIQWLDKETTSALAFALRRLSGERVGLVASLRLQHRTVPPELVESLPPERVTRLPIGSMSVDALHRVIRLHAGRTLPRPTLEHTHEVTGGNPFYALQLVRSLPADEPRATLEVPPSIATLTHQRLGRLPRAVRRLLEPAALLRDPTVRMLVALSAEPGRVGERLDHAVAAGVVELSSDGIRFAHPLLAEGMATMIGPGRRRELHAELASLVEDPEQRARHLALAASGPSPEIADQVETGARAALARGASATAAELLETAAALTPRDQGTDRWRRTIEAARTSKAAGLPAQGRKLLQAALDELPVGPQRADALVALAELSNDDFEAADSALAQALDNARGDDERLSVIHRERAYGSSSHVGYDTAVRHARFSVAAAERAGEPRVLIPALTYLAALETWHGRIESDSLDRALELQRRDRLPLGYTYSPNLVLGLRQMAVDRLDEARGLFEAEAVDAERRGDDYAYSSLLVYLVELECRAANFRAAAAHASECALRSEQRGEQYQAGAALWAKALVDAHLGRVEEARAVAERGTALSIEIGEEVYGILNQFSLGFAELSLGDHVRADDILRPLPARLVELGWDEPSLFPVWPNAIEALIAVDELDVASDYLGLFEERAILCDCPWALATAARCRGLLLVAAGDADRALTAYGQALKEHQRTPGAFERCRTLLALGSAHPRARRRMDARETLQAALAGFDELGATLWAAKTRSELG